MLNPAALNLVLADPTVPVRLEQLITASARCGQSWLDGGLRMIARRPGKRLRPALVFAAAACGPTPDMSAAVVCAAAVELMHLSSLVHDDLMDDTDTRGGMPTLHSGLGAAGAILAGDALLAASNRLAADVSAAAAGICARAYTDMCVGQARELAARHDLTATIPDYLATIGGKTGALMRAACELGGRCAGLSSDDIAALAAFGFAFGIVFQLVDDLLDVISTAELLGKPVEQDVGNGVYTACVLAALRRPDTPLSTLLTVDMTPERTAEAYRLVRAAGVSAALDLIDRYLDDAAAALEPLRYTPAVASLVAFPAHYAWTALCGRVAPEHRELLAATTDRRTHARAAC